MATDHPASALHPVTLDTFAQVQGGHRRRVTAHGRMGGKVLICYLTQSGDARERWVTRDRVELTPGEFDNLPRYRAPRCPAYVPDFAPIMDPTRDLPPAPPWSPSSDNEAHYAELNRRTKLRNEATQSVRNHKCPECGGRHAGRWGRTSDGDGILFHGFKQRTLDPVPVED